MVEIIDSTVYAGEVTEMLQLVEELADDLVSKCGLTKVSEVDTETEYSAILLYPDNYKALKVSVVYDETSKVTYSVSEGHYTSEFVQEATGGRDYYKRSGFQNKWFRLYVLNGGNCFTIKLNGPSSSSGYIYSVTVSNSVTLVGEDGTVYYGVHCSTDTESRMLFADTANKPIIRKNNVAMNVLFPLQSNNYTYMGEMLENDIIAFPWVLYVESNAINLGVPTIGNKKVYKILNRHTDRTYFPPYEEVVIGDKRFVNLGQNLIIESD